MTDIDTSPEAVTAPDRVWLDPEGYRDGWTGLPEQIVEGDVEYIRADIYGVLSARLTDAEAELARLRAALRVNALRLDPGLSHAQITAEIDRIATGGTPC